MPWFQVEYEEHARRRAVIEADSLGQIEDEWGDQYDSVLVDRIEGASTEIEGGILWDSLQIEPTDPPAPPLRYIPATNPVAPGTFTLSNNTFWVDDSTTNWQVFTEPNIRASVAQEESEDG